MRQPTPFDGGDRPKSHHRSKSQGSAVKRRRSSDEAVDRIAVRKALADLVRQIAKQQHEAAFLRAIWERPARRECILPRIISIGQEAKEAVEEFEALVEELLPRQRQNSRVIDIERSLKTLLASIPRIDEIDH